MKQLIIVRKDLHMSVGKLAAQVAHGSMAFLTTMICRNAYPAESTGIATYKGDADEYRANLTFDRGLYEHWIDGEYKKVVLQAKNKNQLLKAKTVAEELGLMEGEDFFFIRDNCHTELEPEEDGRTLTVLGFKPLEDELADKIGKQFHLYVG